LNESGEWSSSFIENNKLYGKSLKSFVKQLV